MNCYYYKIPSVIISYICSFIPIFQQKTSYKINSEFTLNHISNLIKIRKIQRCFRKNRINLQDEDISILSKERLYRYYIIHYNNEFFLPYPEFMAKKRCLDSNRRETWQNYIDQNIPDIETRKRSDVLKFFKDNNITTNEIMIAGW